MSKTNEAIQAVRDFAEEHGINKWQLAVKSDLHVNTLKDMDKADWRPTTKVLLKIEKYIEEHSA